MICWGFLALQLTEGCSNPLKDAIALTGQATPHHLQFAIGPQVHTFLVLCVDPA